MYDNDSYCDWYHSMANTASAAAATEILAGPAQGEVWRVIAASAYHDDVAAHTLNWWIHQGATRLPFENGASCATNVKHQLYDRVKVAAPIMLRYGEYIECTAEAAMGAGKKLYINIYCEVLLGVTS